METKSGAMEAFGEGDTKGRIINVLKFKKKSKWVWLTALLVVFCVGMLLLLSPKTVLREVWGADYVISDTLYAEVRPAGDAVYQFQEFSVTADYHLYGRETEEVAWVYLGALETYDRLTSEELNGYLPDKEQGRTKKLRIGQITDAYRLQTGDEQNHFYLLCQTNRGETLLGYGMEDRSERYDKVLDDTCLYWLYELESSFTGAGSHGSFFERSIETALGFLPGDRQITSFCNYYSNQFEGYCLIAFRSGESYYKYSWKQPDWGYAVFEMTDHVTDTVGSRVSGTGYRLLDCHIYEDVTEAEGCIYYCEHPAVMDEAGAATDKNSYDVVFFFPEKEGEEVRLTKIVQRAYYGDEVKEVTYSVMGSDYMVLLPWADVAGADKVELKFYDKYGTELAAP